MSKNRLKKKEWEKTICSETKRITEYDIHCAREKNRSIWTNKLPYIKYDLKDIFHKKMVYEKAKSYLKCGLQANDINYFININANS